MLDVDPRWDAEMQREGSLPFYIVKIGFPYLVDLDFSGALSAGMTVSIYVTVDGSTVSYWLEEGTDWSRGASGSQAAQSFKEALESKLNPYAYQMLGVRPFYRGGSTVVLVAHRRATNIAVVGITNYVRGGEKVIATRESTVTATVATFGEVAALPVLRDVNATPDELDAVTREGSYPSVDLVIDRSFWVEATRYSRGSSLKVELFLGTENLSFDNGEWLRVFDGYVKTPRANADGSFTLQCQHKVESLADLFGFDKYGWRACRPLDRLAVILTEAGLDGDFDLTTLDDDLDPIRSHFTISRGAPFSEKAIPPSFYNNDSYTSGTATPQRNTFYEARPDNWQEDPVDPTQSLLSIMHEFATMLRGCWRSNSAGKIEYVPFDQDANSIVSLDAEREIASLEPVSETENLINQVTIDSLKGRPLELNDWESQSEHGVVKPMSVSLPWVQGRFPWARSDGTRGYVEEPSIGTATLVKPATVLGGICGFANSPDPNDAVHGYHTLNDQSGAADGVDNGRFAYLRFQDYDEESTWYLQEIVAIGKAQYNGATGKPTVFDPVGVQYADFVDSQNRFIEGLNSDLIYSNQGYKAELAFAQAGSDGLDFGRFELNGRGGFWDRYQQAGTVIRHNASDFLTGSVAYGLAQDVTIPIYVARDILQRFKHGANVVRFRLPIWFAKLQKGDVVSIVNDDLIVIGDMNGADESATWEVTSTKIPSGDTFDVEIELTLLKQEYTYGTVVAIPPDPVVYFPPVDEDTEGYDSLIDSLDDDFLIDPLDDAFLIVPT